MRDYLIRQLDDEEFSIPYQNQKDVLRPSSFPPNTIQQSGVFYLEVEGCKVTFSPEPPGLQISSEDCDIAADVADRIVQEILSSVESFTAREGRIIPL
ncbi:MAG: hypothetical protein QOJ64_514 [Acidobacteriota bacterium]|jgi:hypothetical protein|nr:hypothetical protein [Acidobacteriota bacterium]